MLTLHPLQWIDKPLALASEIALIFHPSAWAGDDRLHGLY